MPALTFSIDTNRPLRFGDLAWRGSDDLLLSNLAPPPLTETIPEKGSTVFFRRGRSSQGVTLLHEGHRKLVARFDSLAAPEDYEVGFHMLECAARVAGSRIVADGGNALAPSELRKKHDAAWVRATVEQGARAAFATVRSSGTTEMPGPLRPFHLGTRVIAELAAAGPATGLTDRLLDAMRKVQAIHASGRYAPAAKTRRDSDGGRPFTYAAWGPGLACMLPAVDLVAVVTKLGPYDRTGSQSIFVPPARIVDLSEGVKWIDERQATVEAVMPEDWPALIEKAREFAVDPVVKAEAAPRRWWELWKT